MINNYKKGMTLIETMIVVVVFSILMLSAFSYFNIFEKIRKDVENQENFRYYTNLFKTNISSIEKIRGIMRGELNVVLYDLTTNQTLAANTVGQLEHVYLPLNSSNVLQMQIDSNSSEYNKIKNVIDFWGIDKENNVNFLKNLYVYTSNENTVYNGDINVTYKNFTFIYIPDDEVNILLNDDASIRNSFLTEGFDINGSFLSINDTLLASSTLPTYMKVNWQNIKNGLLLYKLSTKDIVLDVVKNIDRKMTESQQRINDWATIQARYAAYKSLDSGNTMDTDYFISCQWDGIGAGSSTLLGSAGNGQIYQNKTHLKNDNGTDNSLNAGINLYNLINGSIKFKDIPTEYGFLMFDKSNENTNFTIANYKPFSINCNEINNIDSGFDSSSPYSVFGAAILQSKEDTNNIFGTNPQTNACILSKYIRNLMTPTVNDFGYDVYFTNSFKCPITSNMCNPSETGTIDYTYVEFDNGISRKSLIKLNMPFQFNGVRLTYSPYNAVMFTLLPNGAVIKKNLVANSF